MVTLRQIKGVKWEFSPVTCHLHSELLDIFYFLFTFFCLTSCRRPSPAPSFHLSKSGESAASQLVKMAVLLMKPHLTAEAERGRFARLLLSPAFRRRLR